MRTQKKFKLDELEYTFSYWPESGEPKPDVVLVSLVLPGEGRISPTAHADPRAWEIAREKFGVGQVSKV